MSDRTRRNMEAMRSAKHKACERIGYYYDHHPTIYLAEDKKHYYKYAIKEAYRAVKSSSDMPLDVLDRLLVKYDEWSHTGCKNDYAFGICMAAIEDIIDMLLKS